LSVTRGLDRDRVVDETGNQTLVFGRRGARPFHVDEMEAFYKHENGDTYRVEDTQVREVEETIEIETPGPNNTTTKTKSTRKVKKLFTKSGKELKYEMPPPPPWMNAAPNPTFTVPEKLDINENFLREGAKVPKVQELPMPDEKGVPAPAPGTPSPKPGTPAPKANTPPPIIEAPKPTTPPPPGGASGAPDPAKKSSS
jgi:hypothetical protein